MNLESEFRKAMAQAGLVTIDAIVAESEAREEAERIWKHSFPAQESHSYLGEREIKTHGIREYHGALVVPLHDADGVLKNIQKISNDGEETFPPSGQVRGCFYRIGEPDGLTYITVGFSTGATIREITGAAVVVAFIKENLRPVAQIIRSENEFIQIVVAGDDDVFKDPDIGSTEALEAALAVDGFFAIPEFKNDEFTTNYNELARLEGKDVVFQQVCSRFRLDKDVNIAKMCINRWIHGNFHDLKSVIGYLKKLPSTDFDYIKESITELAGIPPEELDRVIGTYQDRAREESEQMIARTECHDTKAVI